MKWSTLIVAISLIFSSSPLLADTNQPSGVQPLQLFRQNNIHSSISDPAVVRPLLTPQAQEAFLHELETQPPQWDQLHDPPGEEHGARLFELNRLRDDLREGHPLLEQRVAFTWTGILREYHEGHQGYKVVMGPVLTQTSWGIVRFKPTGLPNQMVAIPSPALRPKLAERLAHDDSIEIVILFTGTLIPWESIIYGFSHDGLEQGMIMPVVQIDGVQYFIEEKSN